MATNFIRDGKTMYLVTASGAESGDAYVIGSYLPCVLLTDADSDDSHKATVQTEGVFELSCYAYDGSQNSAIAAGDALYWTDKDTALSKDSSKDFFGIALEAVTLGSTDTINVLITPKMAVPGSVGADDIESGAVVEAKLGAGAVTTLKLGDDAVTSAKVEESLIQTVELTLDATDIKALYSANSNAGFEIVAGASDKLVEFVSAALWYDYDGSNAYSNGDGIIFELEGTAVSPTIGSDSCLQATEDRALIVQAISATVATLDTGVVGKGLYLTTDGTTDPTGSSTLEDQLKVRVTYRVHDFS